MSKPPLLYATHVDWGHIWQRPHQVATRLTAHFDVTVVSPKSHGRNLHVANPDDGLRRVSLLRAPGSLRSAQILALNNALCAAQLRARMRRGFDCVMVTAPECFAWITPWVGRAKLAYDCMDDSLAFEQDDAVRIARSRLERVLLARADVVFASSERLRELCMTRGAAAAKTLEIPNGWDARAFPVRPSRPLPAAGPATVVYFGTLETWIDFAALDAAVNASPELTVRLVGPNACSYVPAHPRIVLRPPVAHAALASAIAEADAFVLPFRVTELTRAVDPVKLYEYVALGRPVLSAYWPGLERFRGFVTFYEETGELSRLLADRSVPTPPPAERRAEFLARQTWEIRMAAMASALGAEAPAGQS